MSDVNPIRYGSNAAANSVLRTALAAVASYQCYSCTEPKAFSELEIDHLIARTTDPANFSALSEQRKPGGFHVDDPENLGVICGVCNGLKSNRDQSNKLLFQMQLDRSIKRADDVRGKVRAIRNGHGLASHLARAATADLAMPTTRDTFLEFAPGIVQQLARLGEEHVQFVVLESALGNDEGVVYDLRLILDGRLRYIRDLSENVFSLPLLQLLRPATASVWDQLADSALKTLSRGPDPDWESALDVSSPDPLHLEFAVDYGEVERTGDALELTFRGSVDGWLNAHVFGDDLSTATGFRDSMTDVWVLGRFQVAVELALIEDIDLKELDFQVGLVDVELDIDWGEGD